jgi:hypothetical protein
MAWGCKPDTEQGQTCSKNIIITHVISEFQGLGGRHSLFFANRFSARCDSQYQTLRHKDVSASDHGPPKTMTNNSEMKTTTRDYYVQYKVPEISILVFKKF